MTRDPAEGVSARGVVVTGVGSTPIGAPYDRVVEAASERLTTTLGDGLHGLYVYGSVATGQAVPPTSDLDLHAILHTDAADAGRAIARELTTRFASVVREVGLSTVHLDDVLADTIDGHAERCWVRHYCRHVAGHDLRPELPDCRASMELARGFNGDVSTTMDQVMARLRGGVAEVATRRTIAQGSRKLLMSAATLLSARGGGWTTDRDEGARLLAAAAPSLAADVERVAAWTTLDVSTETTPPRAEVLASFTRIRDWLAREYRAVGPGGW